NQVNYLIPAGTANGPAIIDIISGEKVFTATVQIETTAPGLFSANASGQGVAAAVALRQKADNSTKFEPVAQYDQARGRFEAIPIDLDPINEKVFLVLFGTGLRQNGGLDKVAVEIGGIQAQVTYAGKQGLLVGLDQVNLILPRSLAGHGQVNLSLKVDGKISNVVTVRIK